MTRQPVEVLADQQKKIVELEKKIEELLDWRLHDKGAAPMLERRIGKLEEKIEEETLTPEWGGCVYKKIGEIEEKLLTPLDSKPPSQDCASYYASLENKMKELKMDQDTTMNQVSKSLLPDVMMERLQAMEKKIFTYKELQARGIELKRKEKKEEEDD